jgi:hypothetical protein
MPLNGAATRQGLHWCQPSEQAFVGQPAPTGQFANILEAEGGAAGSSRERFPPPSKRTMHVHSRLIE